MPFFRSLGCQLLCAILWMICGSMTFYGQSQAIDGNIDGYIRAKDGVPISQVQIRVINVDTGFTRQTLTNDEGYYSIELLPKGTYTVSASKEKFNSAVKSNIVLTMGAVVRTDLTLDVGDAGTVVEVKAEAAGIEVERTTAHAELFSDREARNITLSARNPLEFYTYDPVLNSARNSTGGSGTSTPSEAFAGFGNGIYNVDGVSNNLMGGARNVVLSAEAISEYQVLVLPPAEFGRTNGAILNAISRSGTNDWHGSIYMFTKQKELSARPYLMQASTPTQAFDRYNYGATVSGPVIKNKAQFFLSYERWVQDNPVSSTFGGSSQASIASQIGLPVSELVWNDTFRAHTVTAKGDIALNGKNRLALRYNMYNDHEVGTDSGTVTRHEAAGWNDKPMSGTAQLVTGFKPSLFNELRFLYAYRPVWEPTLIPTNPAVTLAGIGTFNGNSNGNYWYLESGYEIVDNLTWNRGHHSFKFGFDLLPVNYQDSTSNLNGTFTFSGLTDTTSTGTVTYSPLQQYLNTVAGLTDPNTHLPFSYSTFTRSTGSLAYDATVVNQGYFAQDEFRITPRLKLDVGLRYEMFVRPSGNLNPAFPLTGSIAQEYSDIEPRAGVAWDPFGKGTTVIRAGYGIYHAPIQSSSFESWERQNGITVRSITTLPTQTGAPAFTLGAVPATTVGTAAVSNIYQFASNLNNIMMQGWNLSVEHQITPGYSISISYYGTHATHMNYSVPGNLTQIGTLADGRILFGGSNNRPNPAVGTVYTVSTDGTWLNDQAMLVTFSKQLSHGLSLQAGYQFQHLTTCNDKAVPMVNGGCFNEGTMSFNQENRLTATAVWTPSLSIDNRFFSSLANGWLISNSTVVENGLPYSPLTGADTNGDTITSDRVIGAGYDTYHMPLYLELDFRLSRSFSLEQFKLGKIELYGEAANASDHANIYGVNTTWGITSTPNAAFGTPTSAEIPRQFQLGFRYNY